MSFAVYFDEFYHTHHFYCKEIWFFPNKLCDIFDTMVNDAVNLLVMIPPILVPSWSCPIFLGGKTSTNMMRYFRFLAKPWAKTQEACNCHQIGAIADETSLPLAYGEAIPDPVEDTTNTRITSDIFNQGPEITQRER